MVGNLHFTMEVTPRTSVAATIPDWADFGMNLVLGATILFVLKIMLYPRWLKNRFLCNWKMLHGN